MSSTRSLLIKCDAGDLTGNPLSIKALDAALQALEINQDAYSLKKYAALGGVGRGDIFVFTSRNSNEPVLGIDTCNDDGEQHHLVTMFFSFSSNDVRQSAIKHLRDFFDSTFHGYLMEEGQDGDNYMFRKNAFPDEIYPGVWQNQIFVE
jgi:hypothetical protein